MRKSVVARIRMLLNLNDMKKELPLVSVPVITFNSAKTVIETLESIKDQTYPNIELIISDDCSTDDTVKLCREWVEKNKERFVRTEIITVGKNTGVAANNNRVEAACRGDWVKGIAGDDILLPNCVQDGMDYVAEHPDTIYLFGRHEAFGASQERCDEVNGYFDYSFFTMTPEKQLHQLIFKGNCVPATTAFYHRERAKATGVTNDERIPLLEDWPKWINLLRMGVKFHFIDKVLVKYRVGGISTTRKLERPEVYRSERLFYFLYLLPERYKADPERTVKEIVESECDIYNFYYSQSHSKALKIGKAILKPVTWLQNQIGKK